MLRTRLSSSAGQVAAEYRGTNESFAAVGLDGTWEAPEVEGC
jgi:hypothetical protein